MKSTLTRLLADYVNIADQDHTVITGLSQDSRHVSQGDVFFAYQGDKTDGRQYIDEAIGRGAVAIISQSHDSTPTVNLYPVPVIQLPHLQAKIGHIAARFYGDPSQQLPVFGVTGTNGKTSYTHLLAQAYGYFGKRCGIMGTIGYGFLDALTAQSHTTADPIALQRCLATLYAQKADAIAMEISSHALVQGRVNGVHLKSAVFTNLTRDHLDYHQTMTAYALAKRRLFDLPLQHKIINADDETGQTWLHTLNDGKSMYAYHLKDINLPGIASIKANRITSHKTGLTVNLQTPWGDGLLRTRLLGRFNVSNLLSVLTTLCLEGYPLQDVLQALAQSQTIAGRMEAFVGDNIPTLVVDYAHTPDALAKALSALAAHCQGKLWCVFGCGGNRDTGKRAAMAQIARRYSDCIVVTDDNPRYEDPVDIVNDIVVGFEGNMENVKLIHARDEAIAYAFSHAGKEDMVLIAGKGHESYQLVWGKQHPFSDRDYVRHLVNEGKSL